MCGLEVFTNITQRARNLIASARGVNHFHVAFQIGGDNVTN
jgi:hypothetical protein